MPTKTWVNLSGRVSEKLALSIGKSRGWFTSSILSSFLDSSQLQDAFSFFMKFLTEIIRHCVSNMEAAADAVSKQPGVNGLVQNGFISSKDNVGHEDEERIMKAKIIKKKLLTQRRRRRRYSTLSDSDDGSSDGQEGLDSDLSEGELDGLLNETYSDIDSDLSSLSEDDDDDGHRKVLVNGRHARGRQSYTNIYMLAR